MPSRRLWAGATGERVGVAEILSTRRSVQGLTAGLPALADAVGGADGLLALGGEVHAAHGR